MEKMTNDFSLGLFLWQITVFIILIVIIYFLIKLYRKLIKYLDRNS
jgi:large-conductance mechanosensitive channel